LKVSKNNLFKNPAQHIINIVGSYYETGKYSDADHHCRFVLRTGNESLGFGACSYHESFTAG